METPSGTKLLGPTGPEEVAAAERDPFGWSLERARTFGPVCHTSDRQGDAILLTGIAGMRVFAETGNVGRAGTKSESELELLSDGATPVVTVLDGEAHRARKAALLEVVSRPALEAYLPALELHVERATRRWTDLGEIDLRDELVTFAFSALAEVFTGLSPHPSLRDAYAQMLRSLFALDRAPGIEARQRMMPFYRLAVERARAAPDAERGRSAIGRLVRQGRLTDAEIVAETQHLFIGSGGVWVLACNLLYTLAADERLQERIRSEGDGLPAPVSLDHLDQRGELQALVEEVARWSPIIPLQVGRALHSFEVEGVPIVEGTRLIAGLYATNRDPTLYPDPDLLRPQRAQHGCPLSGAEGYVPFGPGDARTGHRCLGESLVYVVEKLLVLRLLRDARLSTHPDGLRGAPAPSLARNVRLRLAPR